MFSLVTEINQQSENGGMRTLLNSAASKKNINEIILETRDPTV